MSCVLELKNVGFVYGKGTPFEKRAVDGVSLQIEKGDLVGVIGHTGSALFARPTDRFCSTARTFGSSLRKSVRSVSE